MIESEQSAVELGLLLEAIFEKYKYDFRQYSRASLMRRVQAALLQYGISSISGLQDKVLHEDGFFIKLLQYLTIPVSEMFRDPSYFGSLRSQVLPHLKTYPSFKIWVAGCSTGEEAYSLAILLHEEGLLERARIYATDINPTSLQQAESGFYRTEAVPKFTQNYQHAGGTRSFADYYEAGYGAVKLLPFLKSRILFTDHSLATDSVFSEVHLVSCRNVLIYFERQLQNRAVELFRDSLSPMGFLGIGQKESLRFTTAAKDFEDWVTASRIYRRRPTSFVGQADRRGSL